ncbi:MAG TPA: protein kinase [Gemmataceae bacterium]|nr:protein kinase [Gemmataceae bacterium]
MNTQHAEEEKRSDGSTHSADESIVCQAVDHFARICRTKVPGDLGPFLPTSAPERLPALVKMIQIVLERRWSPQSPKGDASPDALVEHHLQQFPELEAEPAVVLTLILAEFRLRGKRANPPALEDYLLRFPRYAEQLRTRLAKFPNIPGYDILDEIGHGGMGVVYKARQSALKRLVALKMVLGGARTTPEQLARFRQEAEAVARLQHPNIVQIHEIAEHDGCPYFSMEYLEGGSLAQRLTGTPLPARPAARLTETLARAIQYCHERGVVHRDLKPANILLVSGERSEAEPQREPSSTLHSLLTPKITDFGLAKDLEGESGHTQTGAILGTASYMAPEQADGQVKKIGPAVDVYALGAILYEFLTGKPPFRGATLLDTLEQVRSQEPVPPSRLQTKLPRDLSTICLKALAKSPTGRYSSAAELADDLQRFLDGKPIQARPVGQGERLWRWCRRNPRVALLAVLVVASVLAGSIASTVFLVQSQERAKRVREEERNAARRRYISDMRLAASYWEASRIGWLLELLDRQLPEHTGGEDLRGSEWYYWYNRCHNMRTFSDRPGGYSGVAYSPDGKRIARGGGDSVSVLDSSTGQEVLSFDARGVSSVIFSPDGKWLAAGCNDHTVICDSQTGAVVRTLKGWRAAFHPDGRRIALGGTDGTDGTVLICDITDGRELFQDTLHGGVHCVAFSPDGKRLACGGAIRDSRGEEIAGEIKIWNLTTGKTPLDLIGHARIVNSMTFLPDGNTLASASTDRTLRLWDLDTGKSLQVLKGHSRFLTSIVLSPDGRRLASGSADQTIRIWDAASGRQLHIFRGHTSDVNGVAFSPDGQHLASVSSDSTMRIWDAIRGQEPLTLTGHNNEVYGVAFDRTGDRVATGSEDGTAKLWNARTGREILTIEGHKKGVNGVAFSSNGERLATASDDGTGKVWDASTGREIFTLQGHAGPVWAVVFSPDSRRLASASEDGTFRLWDARNGREVLKVEVSPQPGVDRARLSGVSFSPDGTRVAVANWDTTVHVYDLESGRVIHTLRGHNGQSVWWVTFSPDGRWLASSGNDATVKLWDAESGAEVRAFRGHTDDVSHVVFCPDGRRLASSGKDGTIRLWDVDSGEEVLMLKGHGERVFCVAFSADGHRLASTNADGTVQIWDARPHDSQSR